MEPGAVPRAWEALSNAVALREKASKKEQTLIAALSQRYSEELLEDRSKLDENYAEFMKAAYESYPDDVDIATLYAEALMDLHP